MQLFQRRFFRSFIWPLLAVFASTRGYTIIVLAAAQYLSARYILAPKKTWLEHLGDYRLFLLVLASSFAIAAGYLINNFYDAEKDRINRPQQYVLHHLISPKKQLIYYGFFNVLSLFLSFMVSYKAALFFMAYMMAIWLYSHMLKKTFWASNVFAAILAISPFFAMSLYFNNLSAWVMYHASFLFLIILIRDLIKDLQNFKGDWVRNYSTVAVVFGVKTTKWILSCLLFLATIPVFFLLVEKEQLGMMFFYFVASLPFLLGILILLWSAQEQKTYLWLHNLLKVLILAGVASIALVRYSI